MAEKYILYKSPSVIDLYNQGIWVEECLALSLAIRKCPLLTSINLGKSRIGADGCVALALAISHCPLLSEIVLNMSNIGGDKGLLALTKAIPQLSSLTYIMLSDCNISDRGCKYLAQAIPHCQTLKTINLTNNNISIQGLAALVQAIPLCNKQMHIYLHCYKIGDKGCFALADVISQSPMLKTMDFRGNKVDDGKSSTLAKSSPLLLTSTSIDVQSNISGLRTTALHIFRSMKDVDSSHEAIEAVPQYHCLENLYLSHNNIGSEGYLALSTVLCKCSFLTTISIGDNISMPCTEIY